VKPQPRPQGTDQVTKATVQDISALHVHAQVASSDPDVSQPHIRLDLNPARFHFVPWATEFARGQGRWFHSSYCIVHMERTRGFAVLGYGYVYLPPRDGILTLNKRREFWPIVYAPCVGDRYVIMRTGIVITTTFFLRIWKWWRDHV
jgi:hypothetical protein